MKGVDPSGLAIESTRDEKPEKPLAGLDAFELRAFLVAVARDGGATIATVAKALKTSKRTVIRDFSGSGRDSEP